MACEKGALEGAICARAHMRSNPKCPFSSFPIPLPTLRTFQACGGRRLDLSVGIDEHSNHQTKLAISIAVYTIYESQVLYLLKKIS